MRSALLGVALLLAATIPVSAADLFYQVANNSDLTITEIYLSPAGEGSWGEDLLHARVLPRGENGALLVPDSSALCDYDLRFVFENGRDIIEHADFCDVKGHSFRRAP